MLILFFAWLLLYSLIYSKSKFGFGSHYRIIEGLEPSATTPSATTPSATTPSAAAAPEAPANPADIAFLKQQIATLETTATKLNTAMTNNEIGVKNNTELIQKVVKSQNDTQTKLASMKSAQ
jgi:hypothetical protein